MKSLPTLLFFAASLCAADFITGQAARLVIGQQTFTAQDPNSSDSVLGGASGLAYAADTLFVADSNRVGASPSNHRVLLFQNLSGMLPRPSDPLSYTSKCPACIGKATVVLGQPDFTTTTENLAATTNSLRLPTAVASDGVHVAVADTNHNRVLIWNRIPSSNNAPADVVIGQPSFTTSSVPGNTPNAKSMRGPQGVWIQNGRLYVADTQNNRVLIWNRIPTTNGTAADVVLGQPDFTTVVEPDLTQQKNNVTASQLLNPVAVSSDGIHLFVTDLGYNRVLIYNSIPTTNGAAADVAVGQPDMVSSIANNAYSTDPNDTTNKQTPVLCQVSNGTDSNNNPTYPASCNATLNFPRFALAAGNRLFIADGGNDRVLVYNTIPTQNGAPADLVIGQIGGSVNQASDAADSLRTPMSLAWDGTNLYVSDAYNRRITVYSMGENTIPYTGVRNSASLDIVARGRVTLAGGIQAGDILKINIGGTSSTDSAGNSTITGGTDYTYTVLRRTLAGIVTAEAALINAATAAPATPTSTPRPTSPPTMSSSPPEHRDQRQQRHRLRLVTAASDRPPPAWRSRQRRGALRRRRCERHRPGQHRLHSRRQPLFPNRIGRPHRERAPQQTRRDPGLLQRDARAAPNGVAHHGQRSASLVTRRHHQHLRIRTLRESRWLGDGDHSRGGYDGHRQPRNLRAPRHRALGRRRLSRIEQRHRHRVRG